MRTMEELNKTHKEQAFGWVLTVQEMMKAVNVWRADPRIVERLPKPAEPITPLDDLHNLAAPH